MADDRPSWIADTLSGDEETSLALDLASLGAEFDRFDAALRRYEHESDKPPEPPLQDPE